MPDFDANDDLTRLPGVHPEGPEDPGEAAARRGRPRTPASLAPPPRRSRRRRGRSRFAPDR